MNINERRSFGFLPVSAASVEVVVGDIRKTTDNVIEILHEEHKKGSGLIVSNELCLAGGYSSGDLLHQTILIQEAEKALWRVMDYSNCIDALVFVGLPLLVNGTLFNVAAAIQKGKILGIIPKTYRPSGGEFQEDRWFAKADDLTVNTVNLFGQTVPIGTDLLFASREDSLVTVGVEICEDVWTSAPPSSFAAIAGATVLVNLSASNELVGKEEYRRGLVEQQSGRTIAAYIYASAGPGESTSEVVFGGHCMIAENGNMIAESKLFQSKGHVVRAHLDIDLCIHDRLRTTSFAESARELKYRPPYRRIPVSLPTVVPRFCEELRRPNIGFPFVPKGKRAQENVCKKVFSIQVEGLAERLRKTGFKKVVLGLSGGLDSTAALLVCLKAFKKLGLDPKDIHAYTMPGFGTTKGTRTNAWALAKASSISIEEISIVELSLTLLKSIGHDGVTQDVTYENAQARARTLILMQKANQLNAIVIGTGDISEGALGWCTYNGDQMSHYNVNATIPKTLVRFEVEWYAMNEALRDEKKVLVKILNTIISPELIPAKKGKIAQKTEDIIGPYALHDFFLKHFVRHGSTPAKILYLARRAFSETYHPDNVRKWLEKFITRFFLNQFKRDAVPNGMKVGSVSLSPRGDWRMPSDAVATMWLVNIAEDDAQYRLVDTK